LRATGHQVTGYFHNHNIHPYQEFRRRLGTTREYAQIIGLELIVDESYKLEEFLVNVAENPDNRCEYCYRSRLEATAKQAVACGAEGFTTTLLYSRYQRHQDIVDYGHQLAKKHGLIFHYEDYREGWKEGIQISKEIGLYRQQYCGCIYSEKDRFAPHQKKAE
jgi:predicted adenine nucleotide alpha hydrolase (AANH) superfamily ATPase